MGCHDAAVVHAELTQLGCCGSLPHCLPLPAAAARRGSSGTGHPGVPKIGEVTTGGRRAEDLDPCDQQVLAYLRASRSQPTAWRAA